MSKTAIHIVQGDITERQVDAIVNAANSELLGGGGVDGAIHDAAGPELLAECRNLHGCATGDAKATKAYGISQAKHIVHTVGPIYGSHDGHEAALLARCYTRSLQLAVKHGCRSIAFPSISTGAYSYPIEQASRVALTAIRDFVNANPDSLDLIEIATFSTRDYQKYQQAYREVVAHSGHSSVKP